MLQKHEGHVGEIKKSLQSLASASNFLAVYMYETPTILRFAHKALNFKKISTRQAVQA